MLFRSKAFNIDGLGPKIIDQLIGVSLIREPSDIFKLKKEDLIGLDRFGEKSADNLIKSIQERKTISLVNFLISLGIKHVGEEVSELLVREIECLGNKISSPIDLINVFSNLDVDKLGDINGVGPKIAESVVEYFQNKKNRKILKEINDLEVLFVKRKKMSKEGSLLKGLTFVLTGSLKNMSREKAKERIKL